MAQTMPPIRECGGEKDLRAKLYHPWRRRLHAGDGEANHRKFGATQPGQLLE
jgi:hypothetical protein